MSDDNFKSIPKYTKLLYLNDTFNQPLKKGDIPNSVTNMHFDWKFNQPLNPKDIPNSVTILILVIFSINL
jgi:hypothetical protein